MKRHDPVTTRSRYIGHVDFIGQERIGGWVVDANDPARAIDLVVYGPGSTVVGEGSTSIPRKDIALLYEGATKAGFSIPISVRELRGAPFELAVRVRGTAQALPAVPGLQTARPIAIELSPAARDHLDQADAVLGALASNPAALIALNNDPRVRAKVDPGMGNILLINGARGTPSELFRTYEACAALRRLGYTPLVYDVDDLPRLHTGHVLACIFVRVAMDESVRRFLAQLRSDGVTVICDFDDLVFRPSLMHRIDGVRFLSAAEKQAYSDGMQRYRALLQECDLAFVTTEALRSEVERSSVRCAVVGNYPLASARDAGAAVSPTASGEEFVVGYYSGTMTHQADFAQCAQALAVFLRRNRDARLRIVGKLDLEEFPQFTDVGDRIERRELMPYRDMIADIAGCAVVIAPLEVGNEFCEAKSELKFFDAALAAVPVIASATGTFRDVIQHGVNGFLAASKPEWLSILEQCHLDRDMLERCGMSARETVRSRYSPHEHAASYARGLEAAGLAAPVPKSRRPAKASVPRRRAPARSRTPGRSLAILLPEMMIGSGGHRKALAFCREYVRRGGQVEICCLSDKSDGELQWLVDTYYFRDCGSVRAYRSVPPSCDIAVATSWATAYEVAAWTDAGEKFYFVQDFEPLFSPMSTDHAMALHSYRLGLQLVSFGRWNAQRLQREVGLASRTIDFPIDHEVYFPAAVPRRKQIAFYARPSQPRRLYELGLAVIDIVRPLAPDWTFVLFGEEVDLAGRQGLESRGRITDPAELARLYRESSLGLAFSTTNPSLIPFEMLGCGLPVVDVDLGGDGADFAGCEAILRAPPLAEELAARILRTIADPQSHARLSAAAVAWARRLPGEEQFAADVLAAIGAIQP